MSILDQDKTSGGQALGHTKRLLREIARSHNTTKTLLATAMEDITSLEGRMDTAEAAVTDLTSRVEALEA